jgi:hypothetical protein
MFNPQLTMTSVAYSDRLPAIDGEKEQGLIWESLGESEFRNKINSVKFDWCIDNQITASIKDLV